ncbi:hypothetical protein EDB19DRAFT_1903658 [Suillus lakei]|nr:hypothetical protein EDB19DRAFT_1903658 [Suillus lakei]
MLNTATTELVSILFSAPGAQEHPVQNDSTMHEGLHSGPYAPHTDGNAMAVDGAATVGTPIKLVPSVAAFRKAPAPAPQISEHAVPIPIVNARQSPARSVLGHVGDLLFGW